MILGSIIAGQPIAGTPTASSSGSGSSVLRWRGWNMGGVQPAATNDWTTPLSSASANGYLLPVFVSTTNSTSNNVDFITGGALGSNPLTTYQSWFNSAKSAGASVWLALYLSLASGGDRQTITPSDIATFFTNLQARCTDITTMMTANGADSDDGFLCGVEILPYSNTGDTPSDHMDKWQACYTAVKATGFPGIVSAAVTADECGLQNGGTFQMDFSIWDCICVDAYWSAPSDKTTATDIFNWWTSNTDLNTFVAAGLLDNPWPTAMSLLKAKYNKPLVLAELGITPYVDSQTAPGVVPSGTATYNADIQTQYLTAYMNKLRADPATYDGIFVFSGDDFLYNSPLNGPDQWGLGGQPAYSVIADYFADNVPDVPITPTTFSGTAAFRIGYINGVATGTLTASTAEANLPITNLQDPRGVIGWQTTDTSVSGQWFKLDMGASYNIGAFILAKTNLTTAATVRWEIYADSGFTTQIFDSGTNNAGIVPGIGMSVYLASQSGRYVKMTVSDLTNPDQHLNIGQAFVGPLFTCRVGLAQNSSLGIANGVTITQSKFGQSYINDYWTARQWQIALQNVGDDEWQNFQDLDVVGKAGASNVFFCPDVSSSNINREAILGTCQVASIGYATNDMNARAISVQFQERL